MPRKCGCEPPWGRLEDCRSCPSEMVAASFPCFLGVLSPTAGAHVWLMMCAPALVGERCFRRRRARQLSEVQPTTRAKLTFYVLPAGHTFAGIQIPLFRERSARGLFTQCVVCNELSACRLAKAE